MEKADTLLLFPISAMGHLIPMVELAKRLLYHSLSIRVLLLKLTFLDNGPMDAYISSVKASHTSISFHHLPTITLPSPSSNAFTNLIEITLPSNRHFHHYLHSSLSIRTLILDFFIGPALDVAAELQLPTYIFSPVNASTLSACLYMPTLHSQSDANIKQLGDALLHLLGFLYPIPTSYIPNFLSDHVDEAHELMLATFMRVPTLVKGVLVNSFEALEARVLRAVADDLCVPGHKMPPIYCVGPITASEATSEPHHESLEWLDRQPSGSVVILNFGSMGIVSEAQTREIAVGLERSGQRFLWVVRGLPPPSGLKGGVKSWTEPDLKMLMPKGFEERTGERGIVVKSWAPQVELLEHEAVGGFVTHCGWNSVLEAVVVGVAMVTWRLYGEQKMNKLLLMEAGLAIDIGRDENGFVRAEEVEERIKWLMEAEGGRELRRKVAGVGTEAKEAVRDGGTSHATMSEMLRSFERWRRR